MFHKLIHAIVLVTADCNLNCSFCSAKWLEPSKEPLKNLEYYEIFDKLSSMNVYSISLAGGEPLLDKNIVSYIKYIKSKNIIVTMSTNGLLISEEMVIKLKRSGLDRLQFSLDGPQTIHDKMRGLDGIYNRVMYGLNLCKKHGLNCNIMMSINEENINFIDDVIQIAKDKDISVFLERMVGKKDNYFYAQYSQKITEICNNKDLSTFVYTNDPYINMIISNEKISKATYGGCTAGILSCTITSTGDVLACPNLPVVAGNIKNNDLSKIWEESYLFNEIRSKELEKSEHPKESLHELCSGCRAEAYCATKNYLSNDPICLLKKLKK